MKELTPEQCRAARGLLDWSQATLAQRSGVGMVTVRRFESGIAGRGARPCDATRIATTRGLLRLAIEAGGVEFIPPSPFGGAGVRFAKDSP